jgi:hypothetical protein
MVCKTLWNFSEGYVEHNASVTETFGEQEGEELLAVLREYVDLENDSEFTTNSDREYLWRSEFRDVGAHLLSRVNSMTSVMVPLQAPTNGAQS